MCLTLNQSATYQKGQWGTKSVPRDKQAQCALQWEPEGHAPLCWLLAFPNSSVTQFPSKRFSTFHGDVEASPALKSRIDDPGNGADRGKLLSVTFAGHSECRSCSGVKPSLTNKPTSHHPCVCTFPVPILPQSLPKASYSLKGEKRLIKSLLSNHHPPHDHHQHSFSPFPSP